MMKKIKLILLVACAVMILAACSKENDTKEAQPTDTESLSMEDLANGITELHVDPSADENVSWRAISEDEKAKVHAGFQQLHVDNKLLDERMRYMMYGTKVIDGTRVECVMQEESSRCGNVEYYYSHIIQGEQNAAVEMYYEDNGNGNAFAYTQYDGGWIKFPSDSAQIAESQDSLEDNLDDVYAKAQITEDENGHHVLSFQIPAGEYSNVVDQPNDPLMFDTILEMDENYIPLQAAMTINRRFVINPDIDTLNVENYILTIEYGITDLTIPEEARNAKELTREEFDAILNGTSSSSGEPEEQE